VGGVGGASRRTAVASRSLLCRCRGRRGHPLRRPRGRRTARSSAHRNWGAGDAVDARRARVDRSDCAARGPHRTTRTLVPWKRDVSHKSHAGHPGRRRCSSLTYARYARSARLAIRAPRSGTYATRHVSGGLAGTSRTRNGISCGDSRSEQPVPHDDGIAWLHSLLHVDIDGRFLAVYLPDDLNPSR
jgi:hypothetical protein